MLYSNVMQIAGNNVEDKASRDKVDFQDVYLDENYHFLMSLYHRLNKIPLVRKMKVKAKIQMIFYEELCARNNSRSAHRSVRIILRYVYSEQIEKKIRLCY